MSYLGSTDKQKSLCMDAGWFYVMSITSKKELRRPADTIHEASVINQKSKWMCGKEVWVKSVMLHKLKCIINCQVKYHQYNEELGN